MNCKACNTPVEKWKRACPNCGRSLGPSLGGSGMHEQRAPGLGRLSPSSTASGLDEELPLDEVANEARAVPPASKRTASATGSAASGRGRSGSPDASSSGGEPAPVGPTSAEIRALLIEHPERVEPGLQIDRDRKGQPVGIALATDVGTIDLLARDDAGGLVVVMVPGREAGKDLVGDVLRRVGWVRKHRADKGQDVRAIVIVASVPDDVAYAAAAVSDTVAFKTWQLSVTFSDVQI